MYLDFAPMEGITGAVFRRLHHAYFPGVDRYYTPFLSPTKEHVFTPRDLREILPEHNEGLCVVPQLLTKVPEDFLWAAGALRDLGYEEVNLNLGCPSGTVTAKGKGAGMLADVRVLERFLEEIFAAAPCAVSIKTRLGLEDPAEFGPILEVYNRFPLSELIIHPRVRKDFYRHPVRTEAFEQSLTACKQPVSFNGGIVTPADFRACAIRWPQLKGIMIGQGLVSDPALAEKIRFGAVCTRDHLQSFHDALLDAYTEQFGNRTNAMKRMKEIWIYLIRLFDGSERHGKKILKAKNAEEYLLAVSAVFRDLPLLDESAGGW